VTALSAPRPAAVPVSIVVGAVVASGGIRIAVGSWWVRHAG